MKKSYDVRRYPHSEYDQHLCLKPSILLWLAIVYLSRAVTLPFVVGLSSWGSGDSSGMEFLRGLFSTGTLVPSFIAVLVLYALIRRASSPSESARWIWARGRLLLALAAIIDLGVSLATAQVGFGQLTDQGVSAMLAGLFDLYFLAYVLFARRARDTFSDFPAPTGESVQ
jgi:hypothetical protein